jgi:hypothetical protein
LYPIFVSYLFINHAMIISSQNDFSGVRIIKLFTAAIDTQV